MPIPLNTVFFDTLSQVDLLACLALTEVSGTLRSLILDDVLTIGTLCKFLHRNQYLMHHDIYGKFLAKKELARLRGAVEALRRRGGDAFYAQVLPVLGPLMCLTPTSYYENTIPLAPEFTLPGPPNRKGKRCGVITLSQMRDMYEVLFLKSWLHNPQTLRSSGDCYSAEFDIIHHGADFLRPDVLFCGRYLTEFQLCNEHCEKFKPEEGDSRDQKLAKINDLRDEIRKSQLSFLQEKRTLQAYVFTQVQPFARVRLSGETFMLLFENTEWRDTWTPAEFGWWCSLGLSQFGSLVQPLIDTSFKTTKEALLWLFLGAHHWLHCIDEGHDSLVNSDLEANDIFSCCQLFRNGREQESVTQMVDSQSWENKVWLLKEIVRMAPEHGQCRDLGGNLFNYFIVPDEVEPGVESRDFLFSVLLQEITDSPMQYLFEHSIGLAISYYLQRNGLEKLPWFLQRSKGYASKLLRRNRELYNALENWGI